MSALITADIGGTSMRAASYLSRNPQRVKFNKISTPKKTGSIFDALVDLILSVWIDNEEVSAISIASPGPIDPVSGFIYNAPNLTGWSNFPLGEKLRKKFSIPVYLGNDANFAALGEWKYGAGIGHSNLIYLTISTGIGGGIICENHLVLGHKGLASELGHLIVLPDGPPCSCGKKGHLEGIASGPAIVGFAKKEILAGHASVLETMKNISSIDVANAANKGDKLGINAISRAGRYLGLTLTNLIHIFNPSIIILGGGVSSIGNLLFEPIIHIIHKEIMEPAYIEKLEIVPAKLGDDSGLLGALAYAQNQLGIK